MRRMFRRAQDQAQALLALAAGDEESLLRAVPEVSRWSVAEHLAHMMLVDGAVLERLDRALTAPPAGKAGAAPRRSGLRSLTPSGWFVLGLGYIPRGMGRAPDPFLPEVASLAALRRDLAELRDRIAGYESRLGELGASRARYRHFLFGELTAAQWLRFLGIHHHHHLKIVRDIQMGQQAQQAQDRRTARRG
jgi:DinB family protein